MDENQTGECNKATELRSKASNDCSNHSYKYNAHCSARALTKSTINTSLHTAKHGLGHTDYCNAKKHK